MIYSAGIGATTAFGSNGGGIFVGAIPISVNAHKGCNSKEVAGESARAPNNASFQMGPGKESLKTKPLE
jgi:hypothetical protein